MSEHAAPVPGPPPAGGARPVPAPPRARAVERAEHLPDHAARLADLDRLPLEERAGVLTGLHDDLTTLLRDADD